MMSASNDIKITIIATDNASTAFENVVDAADKLGPALDKAGEGAGRLGPAIDDAVDAVTPLKPAVTDAVNAINPLPAALDDLGTSADRATQPLTTAGASTTGLGSAIETAGGKIDGAAGDIVEGLGRIISSADQTGSSVDKAALGMLALQGLAIGAAAVLGPIVIGAALGAAGAAASKLADAFGGGSGLNQRMEETKIQAAELQIEVDKLAGSMSDAGLALNISSGQQELGGVIADIERYIGLIETYGDLPVDRLTIPQENLDEATRQSIALHQAALDQIAQYEAVYGDAGAALDKINGATETYNSLLQHTGPGAELVRARLGEMVTQLQAGEMSLEDFLWNLEYLNTNLSAYDQNALKIAAENALAEQFRQISAAAYDAAVNAGLLNTEAERLQAAGLDSLAIDVAVNLDQSALESTFNIIVGGTNRLAQSSQAVADWSDSLANAEDGLSVLGELYQDGLLSLDEYSAGMAANTRIQDDNAAIQDELLAIQAKHLPLMAELTEQQRAYIESLGDLSEAEQIAALGFMDASASAQAMSLAYLAADAASGALGDTGEATASKIIAAAANADPVMKQMLLDMGLISEGAEGEVVVNFPNATSVTDSVDALKASIDALTLAIGGTPPIDTSSNAAATQVDVDNLTGAVNGIPDSHTTTITTNAADAQVPVNDLTGAIGGIPDSHNTTITATDNASGVISDVISGLNSIPAVTYASVVVTTTQSGLPAGTPIGGNRDGGPIGYANGGMVLAELAEAGPERLTFRDGTAAIVPHPGAYLVEPGTQVLPAPATAAVMENAARASGGGNGDIHIHGTVVIQPATPDVEHAIRQKFLHRSRY
jgi:hypothetical protein